MINSNYVIIIILTSLRLLRAPMKSIIVFKIFQSKTGRKSEIKGIFDTPQVFDETHQNCRRYGFTLYLQLYSSNVIRQPLSKMNIKISRASSSVRRKNANTDWNNDTHKKLWVRKKGSRKWNDYLVKLLQ